MKNGWLLGAALVSAVIVACGGSSDGGTTAVPPRPPGQPPTEAEAAYFEEIVAVELIIVEKLVAVDEALEMTWPTRGRLLDIQADPEFYATIETMLQQAEEIEAPERFAADHDLYVQSLRDTLVLAKDHDQAIADEDLVASVLALQGSWRVRAALLLQVSPQFCSAVASSVGTSCPSVITLPGGPYGLQLEDAVRRYAADFLPRVGSFRTAYTAEERVDVILEVNADIIRSIEQARDEIADIEAPEEFAQNHDRLVQYLNDILEVARAITQGAEDGDDEQILEEFARSGEVFDGADCDFSSEFRSIVGFFFGAADCDE